MKNKISIPASFRKSAAGAVIAIFLFLTVYLLIVAASLALTILCGYGGLLLLTASLSFPAILAGIGVAGFGLAIFIFTIKFLFRNYRTDESHLMEISAGEQPELFEFIREVVRDTGARPPKSIFLSADVNASVFYDSNIWSMFLPVRKNLNIGLGLVNCVNQSELKAIIAHEFGHFSQRSMAIGSYVYNVNKVIYDMLYDNRSYSELIRRWSGVSSYFSFFIRIAVYVIRGIQWVLHKVYRVVNLSYMKLSRAMEFHADEVAAYTSGSEALMTVLSRLDLAGFSLNAVLRFYAERQDEPSQPADLYEQQRYVMLFQAEQTHIPLRNGLPYLAPEDLQRFDRSKLVIQNQWASHPEVGERLANLRRLNQPCASYNARPAMDLLRDAKTIRRHFTDHVFTGLSKGKILPPLSLSGFAPAYEEAFFRAGFDPIYNGFYEHHNPGPFATGDTYDYPAAWNTAKAEDIFTQELVELSNEQKSLSDDIELLENIAAGAIRLRTFDYDGQKYKASHATALIARLKERRNTKQELLLQKDKELFAYCFRQAQAKGTADELVRRYRQLFRMNEDFGGLKDIYESMVRRTQFVHVHNSPADIQLYLRDLQPEETRLRESIGFMLSEPAYLESLDKDSIDTFEKYLHSGGTYFDGTAYRDDRLQLLFDTMKYFGDAVANSFFFTKKSLLTFQRELLDQPQDQPAHPVK